MNRSEKLFCKHIFNVKIFKCQKGKIKEKNENYSGEPLFFNLSQFIGEAPVNCITAMSFKNCGGEVFL